MDLIFRANPDFFSVWVRENRKKKEVIHLIEIETDEEFNP